MYSPNSDFLIIMSGIWHFSTWQTPCMYYYYNLNSRSLSPVLPPSSCHANGFQSTSCLLYLVTEARSLLFRLLHSSPSRDTSYVQISFNLFPFHLLVVALQHFSALENHKWSPFHSTRLLLGLSSRSPSHHFCILQTHINVFDQQSLTSDSSIHLHSLRRWSQPFAISTSRAIMTRTL